MPAILAANAFFLFPMVSNKVIMANAGISQRRGIAKLNWGKGFASLNCSSAILKKLPLGISEPVIAALSQETQVIKNAINKMAAKKTVSHLAKPFVTAGVFAIKE